MEEFYNEDVIQDNEDVIEEDYTEIKDDIQDDTKEESKETDSGFTSKDVVDIIKAITGEKTSDSELEEEVPEVSSGDSKVVEDVSPDKEIQTYDYTELLQEIKNQISSGNAEITEQNYILGNLYDDSKPDTPIDNSVRLKKVKKS